MRRRVVFLVVLQLLIPAIMLAMRWCDPSLGGLPFGWQMHTDGWGAVGTGG